MAEIFMRVLGTRCIGLLAMVFLLAAPVVVMAGDDEESAEKAHKYTNEDLEESSGESAPEPRVEPTGKEAGELLRELRNNEEARLWRQNRLREARKTISEIDEQIAYWKARRLSIRNPLYPRPTPPESVGEEGDPEEGLDGATLVERADEQLEALRKRLEAARADLKKMELEFRRIDLAPTTQPPPPAETRPAATRRR